MSTANRDELGPPNDWGRVSENLFGAACEMDSVEAERFLGAAGIDREVFQANLHRRFRGQLQRYRRAGKPVPPLLEKVADDLLPITAAARNEKELYLQAKHVVKRALARAKMWSRIAEDQGVPVFTMAYRHKKELSERDKKILDAVAEALRKRFRDESK